MIGVDSSVLVRIFAEDDAKQHKAAQQFLRRRSSDDPAFVSAVVVAEVCWVLDRSYGFTLAAICSALEWLFESTNVVIENHVLVSTAVATAAANNADIPDSIIAALAADAGATSTVTFDQPAAKRVPGMELLK